jgi:Reactive mitochondrial oxygen species modulator 1
MGALMGGGVGLTIGFIFGSYSILRYAPFPPSFLISAVRRTHATGQKGVVPALAACLRPSRSTCSAVRQHSRSSLPSDQCVLFLTHHSPSLTLSCHPPPARFHFTLLQFRFWSTDTLPRSSEMIPSCHRILKPRDSRCFLL